MFTLKARLAPDQDRDGGFTLIELMVVVMIIAVLLAIAIPTFLGSQNKAKDRAAQSALRNTVTAAKSIYADSADYSKATDVALELGEPAIAYVPAATASTDAKTVSVSFTASPATVFYAASKSASGTCFYVKDDVTASTGNGTTFSKGTGACTGTFAAGIAAASYTATGW
jgi:type IV pilus assembly protein PilA